VHASLKLTQLAEEAAELLAEYPPVVEVKAKRLLVIGDTHGYPEVSRWALDLSDKLDVETIIFLGDYVDRGPWGVENLQLLLSSFVEDPHRILLLRGNHESPTMNYYYGFRDELINKLGYEALEPVERLYTCLPLAAKAGEIIMLHGGVPCRKCTGGPEEPPSLNEIRKRGEEVKCTPEALNPDDPILFQVLWNDPREGLEWWAPNIRGPGTYYYGWRAWTLFLEENNAKLLLRAHEVVDAVRITSPEKSEEGIIGEMKIVDLEGKVITIFSSLYHGMRAGAAYVDLDKGKIALLFYPQSLDFKD
jgi:protein phosphatase